MEQQSFGDESFEKRTRAEYYTREELLERNQLLESELLRATREIYRLKKCEFSDEQLRLILKEQLSELQQNLYDASSERYKKPEDKPKTPKPSNPRHRLPSKRYPNVTIREIPVTLDPVPHCDACGEQMSDSGMSESSEQLTVIPKKYEILRYKRSVYRCSCHGCMKTAPNPPRILDGSSYSDEMILDVVLSKYCDLIPIERYVQMARRGGLADLPANSLIDLTHKFAFFIMEIYRLLGQEVLSSRVLAADETPHRMLEGSEKKSWYLWGFSTQNACYLQAKDTRSGDVAGDLLSKSSCEVLLSDAYTGYGKSVRIANERRDSSGGKKIDQAHCNAHSRRYFFKPKLTAYPEAAFYLDCYHEIYQLNDQCRGRSSPEVLRIRSEMRPYFESMRERAREEFPCYPSGKYRKALTYYLENYKGLTYFLKDPDVPIDNNAQERLFRSHVVGRKTWYGTHSEQGAETAAVLFSIVESCKLNGVNPREYLPAMVRRILNRQEPMTPSRWKALEKGIESGELF